MVLVSHEVPFPATNYLLNSITVKALNSALLSSGKALISGQKLGDQLFLCSKSPQ